jgi:transposase
MIHPRWRRCWISLAPRLPEWWPMAPMMATPLARRSPHILLTAGQVHDLAGADALLKAKALLADKAFDADKRVIKPLGVAGIIAVIPPKRHRKSPRTFDKPFYDARHLIENFFCWVKQFPAIATRNDKTVRNFLAAFNLVAVLRWLNRRQALVRPGNLAYYDAARSIRERNDKFRLSPEELVNRPFGPIPAHGRVVVNDDEATGRHPWVEVMQRGRDWRIQVTVQVDHAVFGLSRKVHRGLGKPALHEAYSVGADPLRDRFNGCVHELLLLAAVDAGKIGRVETFERVQKMQGPGRAAGEFGHDCRRVAFVDTELRQVTADAFLQDLIEGQAEKIKPPYVPALALRLRDKSTHELSQIHDTAAGKVPSIVRVYLCGRSAR